MQIVVVGLNHRTAPIPVLERLAIADDELVKALHQLGTYEHVLEGAILSTCNRIEVYAVVSRFHGGALDLRNFLAEFRHVAPEEFTDHLYTYHEDGAVGHLFRVAAGIDSMVIGESEILGQVRHAYQVASEEGKAPHALGAAFRRALRVGKRARSETAIGRNPVSISSAAVGLAKRAFGDSRLVGKRVAIVGAGKMGRLAAQALASSGAGDVTVVNRSEERGRALAEAFGATARPFEELGDVLASADILISSTTSSRSVIDKPMIEDAMQGRGSPLFIVDIAVPRDVDPSAADVPGVVLRDIDDLRGVVDAGVGNRLSEVSKVEDVIAEELESFIRWERATEAGPTVAALLERVDSIKQQEIDRMALKLSTLSEEERAVIEQMVSRIIAKLLHVPINRAKELAGSKQGYLYLTALRELFELDDEPTA